MMIEFNPEEIRAVLFDFDGTLRHNRPDANQFFFDYASQLGAVDSPINRRRAYQWAHSYWNSDGGVREDVRALGRNTPEFWDNYARNYLLAFGCSRDQAEAYAPAMNLHMSENYKPENWIDPETEGVLTHFQARDLLLGVVSNRDEPFWGELVTLELCPYFMFSLSAGEAKSWKPHPGIFENAIAIIGVDPAETVYIGDNYYADIVGARNAGIHPILIDPFDIFPDADCPVIQKIGDLLPLFQGLSSAKKPEE